MEANFIPSNIWYLTDSEFESFTFTGGKVIYIAEELPAMYKNHPSIITAGVLLPPVEAIHAELDGDIQKSTMIYESYLASDDMEANMYISIIVAAAINRNSAPVGIMFGKDEMNMQFPKMLINFLYQYHGIIIGVQNPRVDPCIDINAMPFNLCRLYKSNLIDYTMFMQMHPNLPIFRDPMLISKMAIEVNPYVKNKTAEEYLQYFEKVKNDTIKNGKITIDPVVPV